MSNAMGGTLPSLVLFDLDDTLCDHYSSLRLRLRFAFEGIVEGFDEVDLDDLVEASALQSVTGTDHFAELLRQRGIDDPARAELAAERYLSDRYRGLVLFEESLEVLAVIRRHTRVGMITNGPSQIQRDKIRLLEIGELFPIILVSEEEGVWKPDPVIFARALARAGATPSDALYVGDSPEHDIAGARAAGLTSAWINRRRRSWPGGTPPDHEIEDLRQLVKLLGIAEK
ncbi:MAG TPA: HAD family hydrolase [Nitrolancea sp.]|nr:HAD family hydrolase [Nitrolancea sp.]